MDEFITSVISRLHAGGLTQTTLERRWSTLQTLSPDEREFAVAAAHLGLDPFDTTDAQDAVLLSAAENVPGDLLLELLDSTDPSGLANAVAWTRKAASAVQVSETPVPPLHQHETSALQTPWQVGYWAARRFRKDFAAQAGQPFEIDRFVKFTVEGQQDSGGVEAYSESRDHRTGLVLPADIRSGSRRFAQARALGQWYVFRQSHSLLPPTHTWQQQAARAFAAELLLPGDDLAVVVHGGGRWTQAMEEALATRYEVGPQLVRHQLENHRVREQARR
ncbi:MAG: ImmA/IrrE family metallo-endopeptidase [Propionibacteriaceae bacterium]|nr:ImmA/IrrE family metallo-endopeptidase [Propionibacteriaceae bacterium]